MRQLKALQTLAEAVKPFTPFAKVSSGTESKRRGILDRMEKLINQLDTAIDGTVLKNMLADGGFPATESKALIKKFTAFHMEFDDFRMALLQEFDSK